MNYKLNFWSKKSVKEFQRSVQTKESVHVNTGQWKLLRLINGKKGTLKQRSEHSHPVDGYHRNNLYIVELTEEDKREKAIE